MTHEFIILEQGEIFMKYKRYKNLSTIEDKRIIDVAENLQNNQNVVVVQL